MIVTAFGIVVALLGARYLVRASLKVALAFLIVTTFLLPGTVLVPGSFSAHTTLHRIVLGIFVLNVLRKVAFREIPISVLRPNGITVAVGAWVVLSFAVGVAFADQALSLSFSSFLWIIILDYAVFFYFVLAALRALNDPWWFARLLAVMVVVSAVMAVYEHFAGDSVARRIARLIRPVGYVGVNELGTRGGDPRPQAGADFSLAYAWVATVLLPLVVVVASRAKRAIVRFAPGLVVLAIAWTYTRSTVFGLGAAVVLLLAASGFDRRIVAFAVSGLLVGGLFIAATPVLRRTFESPEVQGSTQIREERFPFVLSKVSEHPFIGRGLSSVTEVVRTTDSSFLLTYAELGVVGLLGLSLLIVVTATLISPAVRAPPPDRLLGAAALCAVVLTALSAAFLDVFNVSGSARAFWAAAALGIVVCERTGVRWPVVPVKRLVRRAWVPAAGVAAGIFLIATTAPTAAATIRFTTRAVSFEAGSQGSAPFVGTILVNTTCEIIRSRVESAGHEASCYDLQSGLGIAEARIETPDLASLQRIAEVFVAAVRATLRSPRFYVVDFKDGVRPTLVRTAPLWLGAVGATLAAFVPPLPPLRRRRRTSGLIPTPIGAEG